MDAGTGQPVGGAIVSLMGAPRPPSPPIRPGGEGFADPVRPTRLITGSNGQFAFSTLPRGTTYGISVQKPGYLPGAYGMRRAEGTAQMIALEEGERRDDITIRLFRHATIAGTVVDDTGEPFVGVNVRAVRRMLIGGRRVLGPRSTITMTDDRGMYRIGSLTPGEYVVAVGTTYTSAPASRSTGPVGTFVSPDRRFVLLGSPGGMGPTWDPTGRLIAYPSIYFPAARTAGQATPINLASGEERLGVDIVLPATPAASVSGRLIVPDGTAGEYVLRLGPSETGRASAEPDVAIATTDGDGSFMFLGVPAGGYVLQTSRTVRAMPPVVVTGGRGEPAPPAAVATITYWAALPISVGDADVRDLSVVVQKGLTIAGRVEYEGSLPAPDRPLRVSGQVESLDAAIRTGAPFSSQTPDNRFVTTGLPPGRYAITVNGVPAGWTLKSVVASGGDISDTSFDLLDRDLSDVVIALTDRVSTVGGTVRNAQGDADGAAMVAMFPTDARFWQDYGLNPRRLKFVPTSPKGTFGPVALPPGDYHVAAVSQELTDEWLDPAFLETLARHATRVTVGEGQRLTLALTRATVRIEHVDRPGDDRHDVAADGIDRQGGPFVDEQVRDARLPPAPPDAGGAVAGVVLSNDASSRPIGRARVSLRHLDGRHDYAGMSDASGRFLVSGVPPGRYTVTVSKPAYLTAYYGTGQGVLPPGLPVTVSAGQTRAGITLRLVRGGVLSGTVRDDFGTPVPAARVQVLQPMDSGMERRFVPAPTQGAASTDDRGVYRIYGLQPGRYLIGVQPVAGLAGEDLRAAQNPAKAVGYAPVFYPAAMEPAEAPLVTVTAGQETAGLDITMRLVPTARVEGTVTLPDGQPASSVQMQFVSRTQIQSPVSQMGGTAVGSNGRFAVSGLAPGRYTLMARSVDRSGPAPPAGTAFPTLWAQQDVEVRGEDLYGVALVLHQALTISGRVVFEGTTADALFDVRSLRILATGVGTSMLAPHAPPVPIDAEGRFAIANLVPGQYSVTASALSIPGSAPVGTWSLTSIMSGGRDLMDYPLDLRPGQPVSDMVVTYTNRTAELSGRLLDASDRPVVDLMILLFPTDPALWSPGSRRVRPPVRPAPDGTFRFLNVAPGDYYLGAVTDIEPRDAGDPAFLDRLAPAAMRLTIAPGERKVQDIRIAGRPPASDPGARPARRHPPGR